MLIYSICTRCNIYAFCTYDIILHVLCYYMYCKCLWRSTVHNIVYNEYCTLVLIITESHTTQARAIVIVELLLYK